MQALCFSAVGLHSKPQWNDGGLEVYSYLFPSQFPATYSIVEFKCIGKGALNLLQVKDVFPDSYMQVTHVMF